MKIHNSVGIGFGSIFLTYTVGANVYFNPIRTHMHFPTPDYGLQNTKYNMDYYRKSYFYPENLQSSKWNIAYVPLDPVADYIYILT